MIKRTLTQIAHMLDVTVPENTDGSIPISGVCTDSRTVRHGQLFIPLRGPRFDGHLYAAESLSKGAAAILWQRDAGPPPEKAPAIIVDDTLQALQKLAARYREQVRARVVAVTGSVGKTTTKDMIAAVLSTTYKVLKTEGNLNNHIGLPLTLLNMDEDTEIAVLEMGMSGRGEIQLLSEISRPEAAVITNIGESHLLQLGSRKEIAKAKLEILSGLTADGLLLYPGDEPLLGELLDNGHDHFRQEMNFPLPAQMKTIRFGETDDNDLYPIAVMQDGVRSRFHLNDPSRITFEIPAPGRHHVRNAICAIGIGRYMGVSLQNIAKGLAKTQFSGMRTEWIKSEYGFTVINDAYNSSPSAMRAALEWVSDLNGYAKKMLIIADMLELGEREVEFHRELGEQIDPRKLDYVLTYGELSKHTAQAAQSRFPQGHVRAFENKQELADWALQRLSPADLVFVKGSRGMRMEEVVHMLTVRDGGGR